MRIRMIRGKPVPVRQGSTLGTDLTIACVKILGMHGCLCWRNNTGVARYRGGENDRDRFVRYGYPGSADILGILPGGRFLAVECKAGVDQTTPAQEVFLGQVIAAGGWAIVVRSIDELSAALRKVLAEVP